jgi:hypothetical protein
MAVFGGPGGGRIDGGPSDRHFEILASHGITDGVPDKFLPQPQQNTGGGGGLFGYKNLKDLFDGGGPGRSGARFSTGDTGAYDTDKDGYISEAEYAAAEANNPNFASTQGGIAALSNYIGARPRGSYGRERALGPQGTNIGTSGIANYVAGGGMFGSILGGGPNKLQQAYPGMDQGMMFTMQNLINSGMTPEQAREYIGATNTGGYSPKPPKPKPMYGGGSGSISPMVPTNPPMLMNMGGLMALRDYNMGRQMGMGQSV